MQMRSSSTPVLGSLLSSFSDNPNHNHYYQAEPPHTANKHTPTTIHHNHNKLSFHQPGYQNFTTFSYNSSPISPRVSEFSGLPRCSHNGFRRVQSEGNLEGLANTTCKNDEFGLSMPSKKCLHIPKSSILQTIQSYSSCNSISRYEDEDIVEEEDEIGELEDDGLFENAVRTEERFETTKVSELKKNMDFNDEMIYVSSYGNMGFKEERGEVNPYMYLANGLGVTDADNGFGGGGGGNDSALEEHYKKMVEENPGNPMFLRNYAQFLYQSKGDLQGAECYYSRAILADPKDGEILSQYAKLVWELHGDKDRAISYFERSVQTASEDSHVHAAYANFLWETEDEDYEDDSQNVPNIMPPFVHRGAMASTTA